MRLIRLLATASITGTNYCPDALQLIILIVRRLLVNNHLFTQRSSCIGGLQVEKHVSLFVQA